MSDRYVNILNPQLPPPPNRRRRLILASLGALSVAIVVLCISALASRPVTADSRDVIRQRLGFKTENEYANLFEDWKQVHRKTYTDEDEHSERYEIFKANVDYIERHNSEGHDFELALNSFADMSRQEFQLTYLGYRPDLKQTAAKHVHEDDDITALPSQVDWRGKAVSKVKNQARCGSCWTFAATGALEGLAAIQSGKVQSFSEQQLIDCVAPSGKEGCNGGFTDDAFKYVEKKGISLETEYPYSAKDGACRKDIHSVFSVTGFVDVKPKNEDALAVAVSKQPVAVAIEADKSAFQFYKSGVFNGSCGTKLDHAVLLVGYGEEDGKAYWLVKNSWGPEWGDGGYIKLARHLGGKGAGQCGIALSPSYPTA
eukprot:GILJ01003086.1.p1 GENE.GILJ01003086.1~~GILJ01003086.1.p1  ORF type:complete len:371 (+),score=60.00 GILJ01003086.1:172-1284(+)